MPFGVATLALAASLVWSAAGAEGTSVYRGAWFEVRYPDHFQVEPSLPSTTGQGADSAFFIAPDRAVSFYVFAPQWGGEPSDIAMDPAREIEVERREAADGPVRRIWWTIRAKHGPGGRSYHTVIDERGPTSWTVGLSYASPEALARYRGDYLAFKESIVRLAD